MSMGKRERDRQPEMWVTTTDLPTAASHPFYGRLNQLLAEYKFEDFVESRCKGFYHETVGRPGLPPGIYFRLLLIRYFEGLDSERGIAWRAADSLTLRDFLGLALRGRSRLRSHPTAAHRFERLRRQLIAHVGGVRRSRRSGCPSAHKTSQATAYEMIGTNARR